MLYMVGIIRYSLIRVMLAALLAVVLGGIIYLLFRPVEPVFFQWASHPIIDQWLKAARKVSLVHEPVIPSWIIYSLPNALWAFAYALIIARIWANSTSSLKYIWLASIPLLVVGYELMQLAGWIPGTFCLEDVGFGLAGLSIGWLVGARQNGALVRITNK